MKKEENILFVEMRPTSFFVGSDIKLKDVELIAHGESKVDYDLNKHEYIIEGITWVFPQEEMCLNQKEFADEEFGYFAFKDIDTSSPGEKHLTLFFKGKLFKIFYSVMEV